MELKSPTSDFGTVDAESLDADPDNSESLDSYLEDANAMDPDAVGAKATSVVVEGACVAIVDRFLCTGDDDGGPGGCDTGVGNVCDTWVD